MEASLIDDTCIATVCKPLKLHVESGNIVMLLILKCSQCFSKDSFRGCNSTTIRVSLRTDDALMFKLLPSYHNEVLRVVDNNNYCGSVVCLSESLTFDTQHRSAAAFSSHTSSGRIFDYVGRIVS